MTAFIVIAAAMVASGVGAGLSAYFARSAFRDWLRHLADQRAHVIPPEVAKLAERLEALELKTSKPELERLFGKR